MRTQSLIKASVYVGGVLLIILVLTLSLTRRHLYPPSSSDLEARATLSAKDRIAELWEWPPTPDHPLYPLRVIRDKVQLLIVSEEQRPLQKIRLGNERLAAAKVLLAHKRTALALSTLTKSTKYIFSAASDAQSLSPQSSSQIRGKVREAISLQIIELERIKQSFSDEQKPIVDRLLSELKSLQAAFL